jgi:PIN domain nuclease of toxin-antitoxin system
MILIDTHVVVWLAFGGRRVSNNAGTAIRNARKAGEPIAISDITLWELAFATRKQRVLLNTSAREFLQEVEERFQVLPITARSSEVAVNLPTPFPKDPADRIIAATAIVRGLTLVTADSAIRRSGAVPTIW